MSRKFSSIGIALAVSALGVLAACTTQSSEGQTRGGVWADEGPLTWPPRPTELGITANDLRTRLYQIADDSMKGRAVASEGNFKTAEYMAAEFERLGLMPAGENGTYFQEIPYGSLGFDQTQTELTIEEGAVAVGADWTPMSPSAATGMSGVFSGQEIPVVFGGLWGDDGTILDPTMIEGKTVVFMAPPAPTPLAGGRGGGRGGRGRGRGGRGRGGAQVRDLRAQEAGASLVLVVVSALAPNAVSVFDTRTGMLPTVNSTTAGASITADAATALFSQPLDQLQIGAVGSTISGRWEYAYQSPEFPARNIIAVLPGSDPELAGQYVLVGAHNDHVGMVRGAPVDHDSLRAFNRVMRPQGANDRPGAPTAEQQAHIDSLINYARSIRPPRMDSVMNGADDDGSGTVLLLEIAEQFAMEEAPRRSIIFISHVAEEGGLLGSRHFTDNPTIPLDSIVAAHNMDMLGKGRVTDVKFGGPASVQMLGARRLSSEFGDIIDSLNAVRSEPMAIDYSWDRTNALNRFCRSDQVNYFRYAIPVTYFSLGYASDYHQATDEPQYIDYDHTARVGRFIHEIMTTIANRDTRLIVLPLEERDLSSQC